MPHAVLKLIGGANTIETPALNENGGISQTQLIRYFYDPNGVSMVSKLGGWSKFYPTPMPAIVRALWAWEDIDNAAHLAVGTQVLAGQTYAQLSVITAGTQQVITPTQASTAVTPPTATPTIGSASVKINEFVTPGVTAVNSVYIATQLAVGGLVLFGLYACDPDGYVGATSYTVYARDILGNLTPATTSAGATMPQFTTTAGTNVVNVLLAAYTYAAGDTFPILLPTTVGGVTLFGNYIVQTIVDANNFTILASAPASAAATITLNNGVAVFIYNGLGATPPSALPIPSFDWTFDNFGQDLVAVPTDIGIFEVLGVPYQPIYIWTPSQPTASVIPQAPPFNDGAFVAMPQRQIVAWGSTATGIQDPLLINWCDVNNPNQWIALATNQAGSYRIPKGSKIVAGVQGPQQGVIWTDVDVWSMQYIGPPYIYSFNEIGSGCGLIAKKAAGFLNGVGFWMGFSQFYTLGGEGVLPLPCPVWDTVFQNLDQNNLMKIRIAINSRFGEIAWYYPSILGGTGEVDSYVKYNVYLNEWDYGLLGRSAWIDQSVLGPPIGSDPVSDYLYQHETSPDADGVAMQPFFQSGYFALAEGDFKAFVDLVWPDFKWGTWSGPKTAQIQITFFVLNYAGDTPVQFGPYTVTQATQYFNTRLRGRLVAVRIGSVDLGSFWRIGALRYRVAQDGKF